MNHVRMGWDAPWGPELAELMAHPAGDPSIRSVVVCMTLFNEPAAFVSTTLQTLAHNLMDLAIDHEPWAPPLLCIMADGGQHLSVDTLQLLDNLGVPNVEQPAGPAAGECPFRIAGGCRLPVTARLSTPALRVYGPHASLRCTGPAYSGAGTEGRPVSVCNLAILRFLVQ